MKKRGNATLIGAFVVIGIALVIGTVIAAGGGKFFVRKERVVMHFSGSIYGLQVGAPVVFRGVRLGTVQRVVRPSVGMFLEATLDPSVELSRIEEVLVIPVTMGIPSAAAGRGSLR